MCGAKYTTRGRPALYLTDNCHPKDFAAAYKDFKTLFEIKTGIPWDNRCDGLPQDPTKFKYDMPMLGRPVGWLPPGKSAPTWVMNESSSEESGGGSSGSDDTSEGLVYESDSEVEEESGYDPQPHIMTKKTAQQNLGEVLDAENDEEDSQSQGGKGTSDSSQTLRGDLEEEQEFSGFSDSRSQISSSSEEGAGNKENPIVL